MIYTEDLYAIDAFNDEKLRAVFDESYRRLFQHLGGDGVISAQLIIDVITEQAVILLRSMAIDAVEGLTE